MLTTPGTVLRALQKPVHSVPWEVGTTTVLILQMRKEAQRDRKVLCPGS